MRVLVVFAHPRRSSFTGELLEALVAGLREGGHDVEIADLYAESFDPILDAEAFERETAMNARGAVPMAVEAEQARLDRCEGLIFVYPFWWSDAPAILKGWFDRVWTYGYAYAYEADRSRTTRLAIRKALALCPAGHTDETLDSLGLREAHRRVMIDDRLLGVGIPEARLALLGGLSGNPPEVRGRHLTTARDLGRNF